ncbi:hypothetical protein C1H46_011858 [Malus baccata]|uniref:RNase H type-1 domain-containing protein n=1 Tax=Malus baccata TaxID=106549 RepID=A0A540MUW5_MALBA|nr:hypothetical protein C1H46_011858 [Malus baccata]
MSCVSPTEWCGWGTLLWWQEFCNYKAAGSGPKPQAMSHQSEWTAPRTGRLKMNIDGSWNIEKKLAGFGIIIRGDTGNFMAARSGCCVDVFSPFQVEAMAVREGLRWAGNMTFSKHNL